MTSLIHEFCAAFIFGNRFFGDILEFGTGSGASTEILATTLPNRKIITFDGFCGLPKTNKVVPQNVQWNEGDWLFDEAVTRNSG